MASTLDPASLFREHAKLLRRRRRARSLRRLSAWGAVAGVAALGWFAPALIEAVVPVASHVASDETMPGEEEALDDPGFAVASADTRRDPLFLTVPEGATTSSRAREVRFENANRGPLMFVSDRMTSGSTDLAMTLPASPADFALMGSATVETVAPTATKDGFGTSTVEVRPTAGRPRVGRDRVTKLLAPQTLRAVLGRADADGAIAGAAEQLLEMSTLPAGTVVASRMDQVGASPGIVQLTLYGPDGPIGSIGRGEAGGFARIDDPWAGEGLAAYTGEGKGNEGRLRIMDGLYAAGVRNGVPPNIVSEAIVQLARAHDLEQFIGPEDRFDLLYSPDPRDGTRGTGHVLYASVTQDREVLRCYVLKPGRKDDYTCMTEKDKVAVPSGPAGFVTPVDGVLRSRFGPRRHPILKRTRMHNGVDWAAPSGTPIKAAFAGEVTFRGVRGGYGNYVKLRHANGLETAYAHMSRFASGLRRGTRVEAGEVIGYVGTTGLSTGPHLHFELHANGQPVDPLSARSFAPQPTYAYAEADVPTGRGEIDKLIARIIHVESAGKPRAKNPRSTATGLGQFIDSTWLRMMRSYRPDLVRSMSRRQLLDLRFEPTMAREMVYRLASENRATLRRAGLPATAGNLYLCHFLGPGGAVSVLRANPHTPLVNIVGRGVINANPFLRGNDAGWVVRWAARKMNGRVPKRSMQYATASVPVLPAPVLVKNERFQAYSQAIDTVLKSVKEQVAL